MKKKYVASLLSLCMICTSISPMVYASETADLSAVSDTVFEEELEEEYVENNTEDMSEAKQEDSDITDEEICVESDDSEEEFIIDESEYADPQISEFMNEENESAITTYASDGYTQLKSAPDIEYKYDENTKTLYFKCADGVKEAKMPDVADGTSAGATEWLNSIGINESVNIKKIVICDGITYIGAGDFSVAGTGCYSKLTEVILPESVKEIGAWAFQKTSNLSTIDLTNVKKIGASAFNYSGIKTCNSTNIEYIGSRAFAQSGVENIVLGNEKVTIGSEAFTECANLKSVTANELAFEENAVYIFYYCEQLSNFSYEKMERIPESSFTKTAITTFNFKGVKKIDEAAFKTASSLEKITFDDQIDSIGKEAFRNCKKLKSVTIDKEDVNIGQDAFVKSSAIETICYKGTEAQWKQISINANVSKNAKIHCRANQLEAKAPTCTESGLELEDNVCGVCGEHYATGKVLDPVGHKFADEYTVDKEATCTEEGEKSKHCTREGCNEKEDIQSIPVDKNNHDWTSEVTTQPTCVKDGVRTFTCSRCKDTKTEAIPATGVHQWSNWKKTADATVFAPEQQERSCTICGKTETQTVGSKLSATATVNVSSVTLKVKQNTSSVKVTGLAKGDSVKTWKSTNTKVFKVTGKADGTCKLTGVKKGTAKLEITLASGLKKTVTVKVQAKTVKTSKISGLAKKMTVQKGAKATLKPVITPATSQQKVTYSSSNKKVATVSSKGIITAKKAGTAKITVKSGSKKVTVTVTVPKTKTAAITVAEKVSVKKGKSYSLKAKVKPSNSDEKITYSTSNKKIATVSKSGKIKGMKKGTATITVKSGKVTKKVKVTVK